MGVVSAARKGTLLLVSAVAMALVVSCSASTARVAVPEDLPAVATATPAPTPTSVPTATPVPTSTPVPTATPVPTPTPTPPVPTDVLRASIDQNFAELDALGMQYSFAVYTESHGYVAEHLPRLELLPASNQKVVTSVGALEILSHDFRFVTRVMVDDERNVYVVGGGDPTLTRTHISSFAAQIIEFLSADVQDGGDGEGPDGETASVGDVVLDPSYFSDTRTGPGWPERYVPADVGPMSGLMIDNNQHRGDAAYLADPDLGNARFVVQLFEDAGLEVRGQPRVGPPPTSATEVSQRTSPSLISMVDTVLGRSDNEIAEALVRQIGLDGAGSSEIEAGKQIVYDRIAEMGVVLGDIAGDGSGLSRLNRLSAYELVEVLRVAQARDWWSVIDNGLADAGKGTLEERLDSEVTNGNVRAKTGTLDDVVSLTGLLTTVDGTPLIFSFIINGNDAEDALEFMDNIIIAHASATLAQLTG